MITQQRLRELLSYNANTGKFVWVKPTSRRVFVGAVAGTPHSGGYIQIRLDGTIYLAHRLAWLYVHGSFPEFELDHFDRNKSNNSIDNLRKSTSNENKQNKQLSCSAGVRKSKNKFTARIKHNKVEIHLGSYTSFDEARNAYLEAKSKYHPFYKNTNV